MTCKSCQESITPSPCSCTEPEICTCETPTYTTCLVYDSTTLSCTGIIAGDDGNTILGKINTAICTLQTDLAECCDDGFLDCTLLTP